MLLKMAGCPSEQYFTLYLTFAKRVDRMLFFTMNNNNNSNSINVIEDFRE